MKQIYTIFLSSILSIAILSSCASDDSPFSSADNTSNSSGGGGGGGGGGTSIGFGNLTNQSHFTIANSIEQSSSIRLSNDGATIVFLSDENLTGSNVDGLNQVFSIVGGTLSQITSFTTVTGGLTNVNPALERDTFVLSGNGATMAWIATNDPLTTNADNSTEIFISDLAGTITQLTNLAITDFANIDISNDGSTVTFTSSADLDTGQNPGADLQIFTINTGTMAINQVTSGTVGTDIQSCRISGDGSLIAFSSTNDWVGAGADLANRQAFTISSTGTGLTQQTVMLATTFMTLAVMGLP